MNHIFILKGKSSKDKHTQNTILQAVELNYYRVRRTSKEFHGPSCIPQAAHCTAHFSTSSSSCSSSQLCQKTGGFEAIYDEGYLEKHCPFSRWDSPEKEQLKPVTTQLDSYHFVGRKRSNGLSGSVQSMNQTQASCLHLAEHINPGQNVKSESKAYNHKPLILMSSGPLIWMKWLVRR